jgi:hypothetical protein
VTRFRAIRCPDGNLLKAILFSGKFLKADKLDGKKFKYPVLV